MRLNPWPSSPRGSRPSIELYDDALHGEPVFLQHEDGARVPLDVEIWKRPRPGDEQVVASCTGPTLDVGCGPGRITGALTAAGVPSLGIDLSNRAVRLTRDRGAAALQRDVFSRVPGIGRWHHVLLLDGNIGIAGEPTALLRRCRDLAAPHGEVIVEVAGPGVGASRLCLCLVRSGQVGRPFAWSVVGVDAICDVAAAAGLLVAARWVVGGRWFATLVRAGSASS